MTKRFWSAEWPNLNDVAIAIPSHEVAELGLAAYGSLCALHLFLGGEAVNSQFHVACRDPKLDVGSAHRVLRCSRKKWHQVFEQILPHIDFDGEFIRIKNRHWISITKDGVRKPLPVTTRQAVFAVFGEVCAYCGGTDGPFHVDHIIAVAAGGTDDLQNLTVACAPCNISKGKKPLAEWSR